MEITVYSKPGCVQCQFTAKALDRAGLQYAYVDVLEDPEAKAAAMSHGFTSLPIVAVGQPGEEPEAVWSGFRPANITALVRPGVALAGLDARG